MVCPVDRLCRRRLRNWRRCVLGAGLSVGLLGRVDGFNPPSVGGGLSLEQHEGLRGTWCTRRGRPFSQATAHTTGTGGDGWHTSRRGGRIGSRVGDATEVGNEQQQQQEVNGYSKSWSVPDGDVKGVGGNFAAAAVSTRESMEAAAKQSVPLKVMVFVDGTWLYYSFFGRGERCHVSAKLGPGWVYEYRVKWEMLPVIISRAIHAQLAQHGQSSRLVEVVRTVVFSSARRDTDKDSNRMQMFDAMREKNFEVHMATTMGVQEKCIDIALAVEMMHYATIPDTYDVGVLVTGDKDFMPAMARTRQKGRRVCLCSMRNSCNQDLLRDDAHVMDFEPVWINDYLDDMMEYSPPKGGIGASKMKVAPEILCQVVIKLIEQRGGSIESRDLGRELNMISVDEEGTKALSVIKGNWQSLSKFLFEHNDVFQIGKPRKDPQDPNISQFSISKVDSQNSMKSLKLGEVLEEEESVSESEDAAYNQADDDDEDGVDDASEEAMERDEEGIAWDAGVERETEESLSFLRVPQLKERLRGRGQPVSGRKADLIARLLESMAGDAPPSSPPGGGHGTNRVPPSQLGGAGDLVSAAAAKTAEDVSGASAAAAGSAVAAVARELGHEAAHAATATAGGHSVRLSEGWAAAAAEALIAGDPSSVSLGMPGGGGGGGGRDGLAGAQARGAAAAAPGRPGPVEGEEEARNRRMNGYAAMVNIVSEALDGVGEARAGGVTSSRALGRELARIPSPENPGESALTCLKSRWPSLMAFLKACPSDFTVTDIGKPKEFGVVKNDRNGERGGWDGGGGGGGGFQESRHAVPRAAAAAVNGGDARHFGPHRGG